jgi:hypothetical protein
MGRTFIRQDIQVRQSATYTDNIAPTLANYETNPTNIEEDLNNLRSVAHYLLKLQSGNWYDTITVPSTFEGGAARAVDGINQDLHDLERKRVLVTSINLNDIAVPVAQNFVVLALGELPSNTTAAIGSVTTLGTVAANNATFGSHNLAEVTGATAISPKNLNVVIDATTRDPILSGGRVIYALFQTESSTDGSTMSGTTPNRAQLSFVRINAAGDDLEAVPVVDIQSKSVNYSSVTRKALEDLTEQDFLKGAEVDVPSSATVTRQVAYDNQGTTPVELITNATLDLNSAGIVWSIRDLANAALLSITEGSGAGASTVTIAADTDVFDVNAASNDFLQGIVVDSGGTSIDIGAASAGVVTSAGLLTLASTGANLKLQSAAQLVLTDQWQSGSTYSTDLVLADASSEWSSFETNFGEVSLINALNQAFTKGARKPKVYANVTTNTISGTDVGGVAGGANLDAQLPDMSGGTFLTDYDVYVNGELMRPAAAAGTNDYYPGTSLANGQLKFDFNLRQGDVICVVPYNP